MVRVIYSLHRRSDKDSNIPIPDNTYCLGWIMKEALSKSIKKRYEGKKGQELINKTGTT